jgi:hypothetical protein
MIEDQFTHIESKQRRYQLRKQARGLCMICTRKIAKGSKHFCQYHMKQTSAKAKVERKERVASGIDLRKTSGNGKAKRNKTA